MSRGQYGSYINTVKSWTIRIAHQRATTGSAQAHPLTEPCGFEIPAMTIISTHKRVSNREQFNKAVHAKARKDALRQPEAFRSFERFLYQKCRCSYCIDDTPRQRFFMCSWKMAEEMVEPGREEDIYCCCGVTQSTPPSGQANIIVPLLDIARPAKKRKGKPAKGVATHYTPVSASKPRRDASSPGLEEEFEIWEDDVYDRAMWSADGCDKDDEWEHIEDEYKVDTRPSYASIAQRGVR